MHSAVQQQAVMMFIICQFAGFFAKLLAAFYLFIFVNNEKNKMYIVLTNTPSRIVHNGRQHRTNHMPSKFRHISAQRTCLFCRKTGHLCVH